MAYKRIIPLLSLVLLASCSTIKRIPSSSRPLDGANVPQQKEKKILYPADYRPGEVESGNKAEDNFQPFSARYAMNFTGLETEHVRVRGVNPLPETGVLVMDLDRLAEEFCYPYQGKFISDYGIRGQSFHTGVDIKAVPNDTIRAAFPGVVRMSKNYSSYGNIVVIRHYEGFETVYSHGSKNLVKVNDVVEAGAPIALAGRTGRATTEHLHFEIRAAGHHIDPKRVIDPETRKIKSGKLYLALHNDDLVAYESEAELQKIRATASARAELIVREDAADKQNPAASSSGGQAVYYRVKKGDTLSAIARRNETTVNKICQLNGISQSKVLQINERLRIK